MSHKSLKKLALPGVVTGFFATAGAQETNLFITEILPSSSVNDQYEVTNRGPAFTVDGSGVILCDQSQYPTALSPSTLVAEDEIISISVGTPASPANGDFWLYRDSSFGSSSSIISGVQWGAPNQGRTNVAVSAGIWPADADFAPALADGQSIALDGDGTRIADWYIDDTPSIGSANTTTASVIASGLTWPGGIDDFESVDLGDEVNAITGWGIVDPLSSDLYTVRVVSDVQGSVAPRGSSNQFIRVRDRLVSDQQRFYSPAIDAGVAGVDSYTWTWWILVEEDLSASATTNPRFTIQHDNGGFSNAWGFELSRGASAGQADIDLVVLAGTGSSSGATASVGTVSAGASAAWVRVDLVVDFNANTVSLDLDESGSPTSLAIDLTGNSGLFRFCYRGEGTDNEAVILVDDVTFTGVAASSSVRNWIVYE